MVKKNNFFAFSKPIKNFFKFSSDSLRVVWKDVNSKFLGCSELLERESGLTTSNIIGLTDGDLIWKDRARQYRINEEMVLNLRSTRCLQELQRTISDEITLLTFKTPMSSSSGLIEGIFQISFTLELKSISEITNLINQLGILNPNPALLPLPNEFVKCLSKREQECLFYLARGRRTKEIALLLDCSPRTIETHIEHIKNKLGCCSHSDIINKVFETKL